MVWRAALGPECTLNSPAFLPSLFFLAVGGGALGVAMAFATIALSWELILETFLALQQSSVILMFCSRASHVDASRLLFGSFPAWSVSQHGPPRSESSATRNVKACAAAFARDSSLVK